MTENTTDQTQTQDETTDVQPPTADAETPAVEPADQPAGRGIPWSRVLAFAVLPALALVLAVAAGFLTWQDNSARNDMAAVDESVQAARDIAVAMLSYEPATVEQQLGAARDLLTGQFQESYTSLINDVVIPGAVEQQIAAAASVPAAASVSADADQAVVLLFINQTVTIGAEPPGLTTSSVRVTLDKVGDRWMISEFEPV